MEYEEIPISRDRCYDSSHELEKKILLLLMCILPMITFLPLKKLKYSEGRDDN